MTHFKTIDEMKKRTTGNDISRLIAMIIKEVVDVEHKDESEDSTQLAITYVCEPKDAKDIEFWIHEAVKKIMFIFSELPDNSKEIEVEVYVAINNELYENVDEGTSLYDTSIKHDYSAILIKLEALWREQNEYPVTTTEDIYSYLKENPNDLNFLQ